MNKKSDRFSRTDQYLGKIPEWEHHIYEYAQAYTSSDSKGLSEDAIADLGVAAVNSLAEIVLAFSDCGEFKDDWDWPVVLRTSAICDVHLTSKKLGICLSFGIEERGFFLSSRVTRMESLKRINAQFWKELQDLLDTGEVQYSSVPLLESQDGLRANKAYSHSKDIQFLMVKNSVLEDLFRPSNDIRSSDIEVNFDSNLDFAVIFQKANSAFYHIYWMNYLLYKASERVNRKSVPKEDVNEGV